jgi:hypothetical protein
VGMRRIKRKRRIREKVDKKGGGRGV